MSVEHARDCTPGTGIEFFYTPGTGGISRVLHPGLGNYVRDQCISVRRQYSVVSMVDLSILIGGLNTELVLEATPNLFDGNNNLASPDSIVMVGVG